jgi:transposase
MTNENTLSTLFPRAQKLVIKSTHWEVDKLQVRLESRQPKAPCPECGQPSQRVHSYYMRKATDLPLVDKGLIFELEVGRFCCKNQGCKQRILLNNLATF